MIIAIYLRVSKDKKGGVSIDVQRESCRRWIERHADATIRSARVVEYVDNGKSAHTENWSKRPQFLRMMNDAKAHTFDLVLVYMFDRFSRKTIMSLTAMNVLVEADIPFYSASEHIDYNTPHGRKNVRDLASSAEFYSDLLGQRMRDVRAHEVRELGLHVGPVPVGYDRHKGVLAPNDEAEGVRELGRLYATGHYSGIRLSEELNTRGYTIHGKRWTDTAIKDILHSPVFAGFVTHHGETFPGNHEALWSADLWERIQQVCADRVISYPAGGAGAKKHYALLTGVAHCAQCGGTMVYSERTNGSCLSYYRCRTANRRLVTPYGMTCAARKGYAPELEDGVIAWLSGLAALPGLIDKVRERLAAPAVPVAPSRASIEAKLRKLARAYADGGYDDAEYELRRGDLLSQLDRTPVPVTALHIDRAIELLDDLPALIARAQPHERQAIVRSLISAVYVYRYEIYAIRPTPAAAVFFEMADPQEWLKRMQIDVRCASNANYVKTLKYTPLILAAA